MDVILAVIAVIFVLLVSLAVWGTVKAVGAARRGVDRTITQARRTVEDTTLRARSLGRPGPAGEVAELRLKLRTSLRATQQALEAGSPEDGSLAESVALFDRLSVHGRELDADLKRLESEPDRGTLADRLPGLRERTDRIVRSADSLRWAALDRAHRFAADDLDTLSAQIDVEAGALRHWDRADAPEAAPEPSATRERRRDPGAHREATLDPRAARRPAPDPRTGPAAPDPRTGPAALDPSRPRTPNPWEKQPQARPESTT